MRVYTGRVSEVQLDRRGQMAAWIDCPPRAIPAPGQYLLAVDADSILATPLFPGDYSTRGFRAVPPLPRFWGPGTSLKLRGPLGVGFRLPDPVRRLGMAALGDCIDRLLPLLMQGLAQSAAVALFSNAVLPSLPAAVEAFPLAALSESLSWVDFLAIDTPMEALSELRHCLGLEAGQRLPCPAQALILSPMPCGGLAECGVCALPAHGGWKLACKDGPVFDLNNLEW